MDEYKDITAYIRAYAYSTKQKDQRKKTQPAKEGREENGIEALLPVYAYQSLTFDTETLLTPDKTLLYGWYMLTGYTQKELLTIGMYGELKAEHRDTIREVGFFYSDELTLDEQELVKDYCSTLTLWEIGSKLGVGVDSLYETPRFMTSSQFVEEFYDKAYRNELCVIGLNLPFDLSRLLPSSDSWSRGTGKQKGSFILKPSSERPGIRIYHLGMGKNLYSLEKFTIINDKGRRTTSRAYEKLHFLDLQQLAGALLGPGGHSLDALGKTLNIPRHLRKLDRPEEADYRPRKETLDYSLQDVLATYSVYTRLRGLYEKHDLTSVTRVWNLVSGASLGKAYLRKIGIQSFSELHPDFPQDVIGYSMNSFMGGRSEVAVRLKPVRGRLRDFSGEYPLVCSLLGLQDYWLAKDITVDRDALSKAQDILNKSVGELVAFLHEKENWKHLLILCKVSLTSGLDRFPVRANYASLEESEEIEKTTSTNIAITHVKSDVPLWYTLQDCIASKLLTGEPPTLLEAIEIVASDEKYGVNPVQVMGESSAMIDLAQDEFFTRIGDLRADYKAKKKQAEKEEREEDADYYDSIQTALKLLQNSTSYGSLVEVTVSEPNDQEQEVFFYTSDGEKKSALVERLEEPGKYFSPLGPFITASGRMLLALAERLGINAGFGLEPGKTPLAFCDTDSMFYVCPPGMEWDEFIRKDVEIGVWFQALSPYQSGTEVFKLEKADAFCLGISAKRYVLYQVREETAQRVIGRKRNKDIAENYTKRIPVILKLSSHGLGAIQAPYRTSPFEDIPEPEGEAKGYLRWIYDLWMKALLSVENEGIRGGVINGATEDFAQTALHQITLSSPHLMDAYTKLGKLSPFSFFTILPPIYANRSRFKFKADGEPDQGEESTYYREVAKKQTPFYAVAQKMGELGEIYRCDNNEKVPDFFKPTEICEQLQYYFAHSELKSENPKGVGLMPVRHIHIRRVRYQGKETNERLEELFEESMGLEGGYREQVFNTMEIIEETEYERLRRKLKRYPVADVLFLSGLPIHTLSRFYRGRAKPSEKTYLRLQYADTLLDSGKYKPVWRTEWSKEHLADVLGSSGEMANDLQTGNHAFKPTFRQAIIEKAGYNFILEKKPAMAVEGVKTFEIGSDEELDHMKKMVDMLGVSRVHQLTTLAYHSVSGLSTKKRVTFETLRQVRRAFFLLDHHVLTYLDQVIGFERASLFRQGKEKLSEADLNNLAQYAK